MLTKRFFTILSLLSLSFGAYAGGYVTVRTFNCPEANQGVAADGKYFYGIGNQTVVKYSAEGEELARWHEDDPGLIKHFDGGIVIDGLLYCSHSNYPEVPMASSVEIFDTRDLSHVQTVSLGIDSGSCTWVVRGDDCWYLGFAHYDRSGGGAGGEVLKDASWTQIVRYDNEWHRTRAWILPRELVDMLRPNSISGCLYVNGRFYCTGHDAKNIFILEFPPYGMRMKLVGTIDIPFKGQGIALDPEGYLWGIDRKSGTIVKTKPSDENCIIPVKR